MLEPYVVQTVDTKTSQNLLTLFEPIIKKNSLYFKYYKFTNLCGENIRIFFTYSSRNVLVRSHD